MPQAATTPRLEALTQWIRPVQILPFDSECASLAARIRVDLEALGTPIGRHDTLIATTALGHEATPLKCNVCEFAGVPGLQLLNWHEAGS